MAPWLFGHVPRYDVVAQILCTLDLRREQVHLAGHGSLEDALDPGATYTRLERQVLFCPLMYGSFGEPHRMIVPLACVHVSGSYHTGLCRRRFELVISYAPGPDIPRTRQEALRHANASSQKLFALFNAP